MDLDGWMDGWMDGMNGVGKKGEGLSVCRISGGDPAMTRSLSTRSRLTSTEHSSRTRLSAVTHYIADSSHSCRALVEILLDILLLQPRRVLQPATPFRHGLP